MVKNMPMMVAEAARRADDSEDTIRRLFDRGALAGVRTSGGVRLLDPGAVDAFVRERAEKRRSRA